MWTHKGRLWTIQKLRNAVDEGGPDETNVKLAAVMSDVAESDTVTKAALTDNAFGVIVNAGNTLILGTMTPLTLEDDLVGSPITVAAAEGSRTCYGWCLYRNDNDDVLQYKRFATPVVIPDGVEFVFTPTLRFKNAA